MCGTPLEKTAENAEIPFPTQKTAPAKAAEAQEYESVFAEGLPEWNIEPPQVMVRRKKR